MKNLIGKEEDGKKELYHRESLAKLRRLQALSLEEKIEQSIIRIREWYEAWDGSVFGAFSGGKDSTVMMDIIWKVYPDIPAVFYNTGLEFPEITSFVKKLTETHPIEVIRPDMPFHEVVNKYGYPVISKKMSLYISQVQTARDPNSATVKLRLKGINSKGEFSQIEKISKKWQFLCYSGTKISNKCCDILKKGPSQKYIKMSGRQAPFVGIMASDGGQRTLTYLKYGCNAFDSKTPRSWPLSFWNEKDIWNYIKKYKLPYSKIYELGYPGTGCMFCMYGVHIQQLVSGTNRFIMMKKTHPKQYDYCINKLGLGKVLELIRVPYGEPFKFGY